MFRKRLFFALLVLSALILTSGLVVTASPAETGVEDITSLATPTIITVTSGLDPDDSLSHTTTNNPDGRATLRRAIVEARNTLGPVEIRFNIPADAAEGYDSSLGIWKIEIFNTTRTTIFRQLTGDITIDGSSQPGGRDDGPKIFIVGPGGGMKDGITLGEIQSQHNNTIRGLGFQNLRANIFVNSSNNTIEDNWFGLNDHGTDSVLRNNSPAQGSGGTGVAMLASANNNIVQNNVFLGLNETAATLRGADNTFKGNYIGTKADGTVDKHPNPALWCTEEDWLGGGGLTIQGRGHIIEDNIIAGLRFDQFELSQPPDAMKVTADDIAGAGHTIRNNTIGLDINGEEVGTCGRGIYLSNHMRGTLIEGNTISMTKLPGISMNGLLYNQCTLRSNIIFKVSEAIEYGPSLKDDFKNYLPPVVSSIEGTTVSGTSGENCIVELFLDNTDGVVEAYESLAVVTADAQGNWTANIPGELEDNEGIRTTCTSAQVNTIPGMSAGTTTKLSEELYRPGGGVDPGSESGVGLYDPSDGVFHLQGLAPFRFGPRSSTWPPVAGDWNGNGTVNVGLYDATDGVFHLQGPSPFRFGPKSSRWLPVAGDWNGNGTDSVGLYDPADGVFHLLGLAPFRYGPRGSSWLPVAGDWNGNGIESVGLYDPADGVFHLQGLAPFRFGPRRSSWRPLAGQW